jgi:hypothetical protein
MDWDELRRSERTRQLWEMRGEVLIFRKLRKSYSDTQVGEQTMDSLITFVLSKRDSPTTAR